MDLSVIIVNYNTKYHLENCLESVVKNADGLQYEVIVVDNASSDGSADMLKDKFTQIKLIQNTKNTGFAKANNQGIKIAKGRYVLLLNSDTIVIKGCFEKMVKFMDQNPKVGISGCKVLNNDLSLQLSVFHFPTMLTELLFFTKDIIKGFWDPIKHWKYMKYWGHNSIREVDCVAGAFLFIKSQVFERVGMLDENIFMYYEDAEFCSRTKKETNFKVYFYPNTEIIHLKGVSSAMNSHSTLKHCYRSARYYLNKCYGKTTERVFDFSCKTIWYIGIVSFFILRFNEKARKKYHMLKELCKI